MLAFTPPPPDNVGIMKFRTGFTLIEVSIVLVIIGLVVGGIVVGKDLIKAAEIRSLISQVDSFKLATNTFKEKYGQLPGDMHPTKSAQFGFFTFTGAAAGSPDEGGNNGLVYSQLEFHCIQECGAFWRHLSDAKLLAGNYGQTLQANTSSFESGVPTGEDGNTPYTLSKYMPAAKGGFGFFGAAALAYSNISIPGINKNQNLFWVTPAANAARYSYTEPSLSAIDTFTIDSKIDDGKPNSGKFIAFSYQAFEGYINWSNGTIDAYGNALGANSRICTIGVTITGNDGVDSVATDVKYNTNPATGSNNVSCKPVFLW